MMMRRILTYLVVLCCFAQPVKQNYAADYEKEADSLNRLLASATGNERADVLIQLSVSLYRLKKEKEEILPLLQEALSISDSTNYLAGKAGAYSVMGVVWASAGELEKYLSLFKKAAHFYELSGDWIEQYRHWVAISRRYFRLEKYDSAFLYTDMVIHKFTKPEQWVGRMVAHNYKADYYASMGEFKKELEERKILFDSVLYYFEENPEMPARNALAYISKLRSYYSVHGYYQESIAASKQMLNSLYKFNLDQKDDYYYRGKCYGSMAMAYCDWGRFDSSLIYHQISEAFFDSVIMIKGDAMDYIINKANQIEGKAIVLALLGRHAEAEDDFNESLALREEKSDILGMAMCYDGLGELYHFRGKYARAYEYFREAIEIKQKYKAEKLQKYPKDNIVGILKSVNLSLIITYLKLGNLFKDWSNNALALENYQQAQALAIEVGDKKSEADALLAIGDIHCLTDGDNPPPLHYVQALAIYREIDNRPGQGIAFKKLGDYRRLQMNNEEALTHYIEALTVFETVLMLREQAEIYAEMAGIYARKGQQNKAIDYYERSLSIASPMKLQKTLMMCYKALSDLYSGAGEIRLAFQNYRNYIEVRDSVFSIETNKMIAEVREQYETEKKDQEIGLLKSQNELQYFKIERSQYIMISLGGLAFLLIMTFVLFIRQERLKLGQKAILLQQQLLRSQMNPHFIFNALTNIQSFMMTNRTEQAGVYLTRFSRLLRDILTNSREEKVLLEQEIDTIENYLSLQQLRFPESFDYSIEVGKDVATDEVVIPPMLAQPFIENAIEHGIRHKTSKGKIAVRIEQIDHSLKLEVEDDGVGREKAKELEKGEEKDHLSMATSITRERIEVLQRRYHKKVEMKIDDLVNESGQATGTRVSFIIPFFS